MLAELGQLVIWLLEELSRSWSGLTSELLSDPVEDDRLRNADRSPDAAEFFHE